MSRSYNNFGQQKPPIVVHNHDVLSGRGVNIAHHAGNERFRTLVTTRADESYCTSYSASEKRAVAIELIRHIKSLDPPGRFLKRDGRGQVSRGLDGPWEELSEREAIKKTCQALRDCNRQDRAGYAVGVAIPQDVFVAAESRAACGLSSKQQAAQAAAATAAAAAAAASASLKRTRDQYSQGRVSPSIENAAEWLKKQRTDEAAEAAAAVFSSSSPDIIMPSPPLETNGHVNSHQVVLQPWSTTTTNQQDVAYPPIDFAAPPAAVLVGPTQHQQIIQDLVGAVPAPAVAHPGYHMDGLHQDEASAQLNLAEY